MIAVYKANLLLWVTVQFHRIDEKCTLSMHMVRHNFEPSFIFLQLGSRQPSATL